MLLDASFGAYGLAANRFAYEAEANDFRCPAAKLPLLRTYATSQNGNWVKNYRAAYQNCQQCPLEISCAPAALQ